MLRADLLPGEMMSAKWRREVAVVSSVLCISLFLASSPVTQGKATLKWCKSAVTQWVAEQLRPRSHARETFSPSSHLLYFLHVPRTAGRAFYQCFLRNLYSKEQICPRSYDKLRLDPRHSNCRLLTTHDDYSVLTKLIEEKTSVVTTLRHPLDRVLSVYEFSIEVAARSLRAARNETVAEKGIMAALHPNFSGGTAVSTLDIWPWKYLVPFMKEDLLRRRDERNVGMMVIPREIQTFYNISAITMPLHEFIQHKEVFELVHNGATFQIAGLANNSFLNDAKSLRSCIEQHTGLGIHVLEVAKERLSNMLYVGLTEMLEESSVTAFGQIIHARLFQEKTPFNKSFGILQNGHMQGFQNQTCHQEPFVPPQGNERSIGSICPSLSSQQGLLDKYNSCVEALHQRHAARKKSSMRNIEPVTYSAELRGNIPEQLLQRILHLNSLDMELYEHAVKAFQRQHSLLFQTPCALKLSEDWREERPWARPNGGV